MKKIALVSALTMLFAHNATAGMMPVIEPGDPGNVPTDNANASSDIDCVKYTAEEAKAATSDSNDNTFGAVFSHASARKGTTNKDCKKKESVSNNNSGNEVPTHSGGSSQSK